jgi:hypothetical protein
MKVVSVLRASALLLVCGIVATSQKTTAQTDPSVGTWVLNVAKSKYDPGPPPKSATLTIVAAGQGYKIESKGVDAAGNPTGTQYTSNYDGKDVPVTLTGSQDYDAVALKKLDAQRVEGTRKKAGKVVQTYSRVISADGKTMTITTSGTNAKGQKINNVVVYEKK